MAAFQEVSVDAAIASLISELERLSSLTEEHTMALKTFLSSNRCYRSSTDWLWQSLIYQLATSVATSCFIIRFVDLIGWGWISFSTNIPCAPLTRHHSLVTMTE